MNRKLWLLLISFIPGVLWSQYQYLKLDNKNVVFEAVYTLDTAIIGNIEKTLVSNLPTIKGLNSFSKNEGVITAKLENVMIDYKKYGGKWANTSTMLNYPVFANVLILWKEDRYRVTISNMIFKTTTAFGNFEVSSSLTKNKISAWSDSKNAIASGKYIENHLFDLFTITKTKLEW